MEISFFRELHVAHTVYLTLEEIHQINFVKQFLQVCLCVLPSNFSSVRNLKLFSLSSTSVKM